MKASRNLNASLKVALAKLIKVVFITFAVLIALDTAGIDLTALTVFGGALGVAAALYQKYRHGRIGRGRTSLSANSGLLQVPSCGSMMPSR